MPGKSSRVLTLQRAGGCCEPVGIPGEVRLEGFAPKGSKRERGGPVTAEEWAIPAKKGGNAGESLSSLV